MASPNNATPPSNPPPRDPNSKPVWSGRPSIGPYVAFRAVLAIIAIVILVVLEYLFSKTKTYGHTIFSSNFHGVPYAGEIATAILIGIILLVSVLRLISIWATNRYELFNDGIYLNRGIVNLENSYLAPMAFSDARLYRSWEMRIVKRGQIIVEANDGRKFYLHLVKDPMRVQYLIRETLGHPTVRTEP
jgi:hypothetical protein